MKSSIFHRFTVQSLKQNRTRTLVTIIGIALSMALLTAIFEALYSGVDFMIRTEQATGGTYHGFYTFMNKEQVEELRSMKEVRKVGTMRAIGRVKAEDEDDVLRNYLILSWNEDIDDLVRVVVTEGRMPEKPDEILLNDYLRSVYMRQNGYDYKVGDTITLTLEAAAVQTREEQAKEDETSETDESSASKAKTETEERTFTICGFYGISNYNLSDGWDSGLLFTGPGTEAVTGQAEEDEWAFFTVKHPGSYHKFVNGAGFRNDLIDNDYLLIYYGTAGNRSIMALLGVFVGILVLLVAVGTISMIYNSFAISVSERTRQFGMLKSIGASNAQISGTVLWEAFLLSLVGIPLGMIIGCIGIGITLRALKGTFDLIRGTSMGSSEELKLVLNAGALLFSALICFIITMIAALVPALRTMLISPMDAIRQSRDVMVREKDVRTSRLRKKLFGFEGMLAAKNFKRNRKRYRTTVVSLVVSVTLFISASAFTTYLTASAGLIADEDLGYDLQVSVYDQYLSAKDELPSDEPVDYDALINDIRALETIEDAVFLQSQYMGLRMSKKGLTAEGAEYADSLSSCQVIMLEDETFRLLAAQNHLNVGQFYNPARPMGIVINEFTYPMTGQDGRTQWKTLTILDESKLPQTITVSTQVIPEGMGVLDYEYRNGTEWYLLYPEDLLEEYYNGMIYDERTNEMIETVEVDESKVEKLPAEALMVSHDFSAAAVITERPYYLESFPGIQLIIPYSVGNVIFGPEELAGNGITVRAIAKDHAKATEDVRELLDERTLGGSVYDRAANVEQMRALVRALNVFSYGFIILIALISVTNVFNTISTNVMIRKREYAMLRSVGMTEKGIRKMTNYECLIYGWKSLIWGLGLSAVIVFFMYRELAGTVDVGLQIPWVSFAIATVSVFAVVFTTMLYATNKLKKDNLVETLRRETV